MSIVSYFNELKLDSINDNEFEIMKDMFTEDVVNSFFEEILQKDDKKDIDKVNKIMDNYILSFERELNNFVLDNGDTYVNNAFSGYMNSIGNLRILTLEEDKRYGKILLDNRDIFSISIKNNDSIFTYKVINQSNKKVLDIEKIFVSINKKEDMEEILKILNNYYSNQIWNETNIDKIIRYYIREYEKLSEEVDGVPDSYQLNNYFKKDCYCVFTKFNINSRFKDINILKKNLRKYLSYMYARNVMVMHNLRLVCSMAYKYRKPNSNIMDIINDGNMGLLYAIDRYDYTKGSKFSTFAYLAIKQSIIREKDNTDKLIRIPVYFNEIFRKISEFRNSYIKNNGIEPAAELIALEVEVPLSVVNKMYDYEENYFFPVSLNNAIGEDEDMELIDSLPTRDLPVAEQAMRNVVNSIILDALEDLSDMERDIILKRYGLDGNGGRTLEEIGNDYNLSRQRINQLENRILRKLIRKKEIVNLRGFYN